MSKEKKTTEIKEEIKEEIKNSAQLTDEQMAEVNGGVAEIDRTLVKAELQLADRMVAQAELAAEAVAN